MTESGVCKIKSEFILPEKKRSITLECVSENDKRKLDNDSNESSEKRQKLSKSEKKKLRGQNKSRGPTVIRETSKELCNSLVDVSVENASPICTRPKCNFLHSREDYLKLKPKDLGNSCYNFNTQGKCVRGLACRFGAEHITPEGYNIVNKDVWEKYNELGPKTSNILTPTLQVSLRKKKYDFSLSEKLVAYNDKLWKEKHNNDKPIHASTCSGAITDEDIIKLLSREKKKINFKNKLFLSPLTTVGNLPFRRICKEFGADVTCGEMAMCSSLLQGAQQEWALVKRHHTENFFGVQLCGNNPHLLTKCGQLLEKEIDVDFIDINLGCPIELVYKEGAGCGLLRRNKVLELCIRNLSEILTIPLTVKTRVGVYNNEKIAHTLVPKFKEWGASLVTVHGRSREQRYTKNADWDYISTCIDSVSDFPVIGNGDILSFEDYSIAKEKCPNLAGVMLGRGALIKPWIFTEIKEQKLWDISSKERFDILKKYANYGLEHWGSDNKGVENTRRFMLEWLSFLYRYVPVGLLEVPPQKINERPPYYKGRDDLETLMASPSATDWIKISEMLLGPVPENFYFLPKHKANSYK